MKIYFGVCGIGLGHAGRCIPIAKKFLEYGDEVLFSTYSDAFGYIKHEKLPVFKVPSINFAVRSDGGVDFRKTTADPGIFSILKFVRQMNSESELMNTFKPDFVISDSRLSTLIEAKILGVPSITILNQYRITIPRERRFLQLARIADGGILGIIGKMWTLSDQIFIPDFPPPYTLSIENLLVPSWGKEKIKYIGPIIPIKPEQLPPKKIILNKLGITENPLIFVPISGPLKEKRYFSKVIIDILKKFPKKYNIIVSLGNPDSKKESRIEKNITIYDWLPNNYEILKVCDLVICRSGLGTLTQSLIYGKPMILIPTPSHTEQLKNARRAENLGVAKILDQKTLNFDYLLNSVDEELKNDYRKKRAETIQKNTFKYDAVTMIIDFIRKNSKVS